MQEDYINMIEKQISVIPEINQIQLSGQIHINEEIVEKQQQEQQLHSDSKNNSINYVTNVNEEVVIDGNQQFNEEENIQEYQSNDDQIIENGKSRFQEDNDREDKEMNCDELQIKDIEKVIVVEDGEEEEEVEEGRYYQNVKRENNLENEILTEMINDNDSNDNKQIVEIDLVDERHSPLREIQDQEEINMELEDISTGAGDTQGLENIEYQEISNLDQKCNNSIECQEGNSYISKEELISQQLEMKEQQKQNAAENSDSAGKVKQLQNDKFPQIQQEEIEDQELQQVMQQEEQQEQQTDIQELSEQKQAEIICDTGIIIHDWEAQSVNRRLDFCEGEEEEEQELSESLQEDTEIDQQIEQLEQDIVISGDNQSQEDTREIQCDINDELFEKEQQFLHEGEEGEEIEQEQQQSPQPQQVEEQKEEKIISMNYLGVEQIKSEQIDSMFKQKICSQESQLTGDLKSGTKTMSNFDNFILIISDEEDEDDDNDNDNQNEGIIMNLNNQQPQIFKQSSAKQIITVDDYSPEEYKAQNQPIQAVSCFESFFNNPRKDNIQDNNNNNTQNIINNPAQINQHQLNINNSFNNIHPFTLNPEFNTVSLNLENLKHNNNDNNIFTLSGCGDPSMITKEQQLMNDLFNYISKSNEELLIQSMSTERDTLNKNYNILANPDVIPPYAGNTHRQDTSTQQLNTTLKTQIPQDIIINGQVNHSQMNRINNNLSRTGNNNNNIQVDNGQQQLKDKGRQRSVSFSLKSSSNNNKNKQDQQQQQSVNRSGNKYKGQYIQQQYQIYQDNLKSLQCSPFRQHNDPDISHSDLSMLSRSRQKRKSILGLDISEINNQLIQNSGSLYVLTALPQTCSQLYPQSPIQKVHSPEKYHNTRSTSQKKISHSVAPSLLCSPMNIAEILNTQDDLSQLLDNDNSSYFQLNEGVWQRRSIRISNNLKRKGLNILNDERSNSHKKQQYNNNSTYQYDHSASKQRHSLRYDTPVKQKKQQFQSYNLRTPTQK